MKNSDRAADLVNSIFGDEATKWEKEMRSTSVNIRNSLAEQVKTYSGDITRNFLEYCNCIKSLLAIYNFGSIDVNDSSSGKISAATVRDDKAVIKEGIIAILDHVKEDCYDICPMISLEDSQEIFVDQDGKNIPVTLSLATVLTTLIYLRRAIKRKGLFTVDELNEGSPDLYERVVDTVSHIMVMLYRYIRYNEFDGWGVTLKSVRSNLGDTYAVVDAMSRFADAFTKTDEKNDREFILQVNESARRATEADGMVINDVSDALLNAVYKVAFSTYKRAKDLFGQSVFYTDGETYNATSFESILNTNRTSALFSPLYVAQITMLGYNDKEVVIRKFMDNYSAVNKYYDKYERNGTDGNRISDYATTLEWFAPGEYANEEEKNAAKRKAFEEQIEMLLKPHDPKSENYKSDGEWGRYYRIARVVQKYIEEVQPDELRKIQEYTDYLNATKDAIDQVQVMYRKINDRQRLGIVDTDYVMFNNSDVATDAINLSKLNKANIAVNSLRPLLLSSKILIVNALTKYPQADMEELYNAIKESKYRRSSRHGQSGEVWLWNEDKIDMNSTARHIEAIAYDYFDYYEEYEQGFKSIRNLRRDADDFVARHIDKEDGSLKTVSGARAANNSIRGLIIRTTNRNIERVRQKCLEFVNDREKVYEEALDKKEEEIAALKRESQAAADAANRKIGDLNADTLISQTFKSWIREEIKNYLREMLSMIVIDTLRNSKNTVDENDPDDFFGELSENLEDVVGGFTQPQMLLRKFKREEEDDRARAYEHYKSLAGEARDFKTLFDCALDGLLSSESIATIVSSAVQGANRVPNEVNTKYRELKKLQHEFIENLEKNDKKDVTKK